MHQKHRQVICWSGREGRATLAGPRWPLASAVKKQNGKIILLRDYPTDPISADKL